MNGSGALMSEVSEWLAIAQAGLGFPFEMVRAAFENAIRFDPSNDRARRNLAAFEAANTKEMEIRSVSAVRTSGLAERRFCTSVLWPGATYLMRSMSLGPAYQLLP
jgi:hypothetical protein